MVLLFPEERMKDRFFRDKDKEMAIRTWILSVSRMIRQKMLLLIFKLQIIEDKDEESNKKRKSSNLQEVEELNFLLKSGIALCKLISLIHPQCGIDVDKLEVRMQISISTPHVGIHININIFVIFMFTDRESKYKKEKYFQVSSSSNSLRCPREILVQA